MRSCLLLLLALATFIDHLDYFGTDGKPFPLTKTENITNRKTMMLVENQRMSREEVEKMDVTFPQILEMDVDLLLYYYWGFYDEDPAYKMEVIRRHVPYFK